MLHSRIYQNSISLFLIVISLFAIIHTEAFVKNALTHSSTLSHMRIYSGSSGADGQNPDSFMIKPIVEYEALENIIKLASKPLPERPDGVVCIIRYTSNTRNDCIATENEYERLASSNPATIFLRCYAEYEGSEIMMARAKVKTWPTFDLFYGGNRVSRLEGPTFSEVQEGLDRYQLMNSKLDLFSEDASSERRSALSEGKLAKEATPQTTAKLLPGNDLDSDKGFLDEQGDKFEDDFEKSYGEWTPIIDDE